MHNTEIVDNFDSMVLPPNPLLIIRKLSFMERGKLNTSFNSPSLLRNF